MIFDGLGVQMMPRDTLLAKTLAMNLFYHRRRASLVCTRLTPLHTSGFCLKKLLIPSSYSLPYLPSPNPLILIVMSQTQYLASWKQRSKGKSYKSPSRVYFTT